MNNKTNTQKEVFKIYTELLKPRLDKYKIFQQNICIDCFNIDSDKKITNLDPYGMDGGKCDKCNNTKEVFNEFIYFSIAELGYSIQNDLYGNIPRIYETNY